jgi:hypothetical protein
MNRPIAAVVLLSMAGTLSACGAGASTAPSAATASPSVQSTAEALFHRTGKAGRYHSALLEPTVFMTLPDGWDLYFDDAGGVYMGIPDGEFLVGVPDKVIDPKTGKPADVPDDLMGWLTAHPDLAATKPTPVQISGSDSSYVEVRPTKSVDVFYDPMSNFHVGPGSARFYVIPQDGPDLFAAVLAAQGGSLDGAKRLGVPIAESLEIGN